MRPKRSRAEKHFSRPEAGQCPGEFGPAADSIEHVCFLRRKLRLVASDAIELFRKRLRDVDDEVAHTAAEIRGLERQLEVKLSFDRMDRNVVKVFIPLRQSGIEDGSIGNLHRLPVVGRGHRCLGAKADHPELLDWLTRTFVDSGWQLKRLHRLIVTSATYRQSSSNPRAKQFSRTDPDNRWYWRGDVRRLDAEQIRDSVLAVSGRLNEEKGGPASSASKRRRSIYTLVKRNTRDPLLDAFDLPLFFTSTPQRDTTTSPLQSLLLINSEEMLDHAKQLADRVDQSESHRTIESLWRRLYSRQPTELETASATEFLASQAATYPDRLKSAQRDIEVTKMPRRDSEAVVMDPKKKSILRSSSDSRLSVDAFTIEVVFQVNSIFDTGAVRTMVSTWSGNGKTPGWSFGVTGKGSRRKPQTLVLHVFGSDGQKSVTEAAIFSDQHVKLGVPYYASATIRSATDGQQGTVEFTLKDLSNVESEASVVTREHKLRGGNSGPVIAIGGRVTGNSAHFDGLIDEVRLSRGTLPATQSLLSADPATKTTIAWWRFDSELGLVADVSENQIHLYRGEVGEETWMSPERHALVDLCHVLLNSSEFLYVR